jgi:hypothetical protein
LTGDDSEFEGATVVGDLCQALSGRVFFSFVMLGEREMPASESALHSILLEYMCSYKSNGVATTLERARELHVATYNEWTTGHAYSCARAFPVNSTNVCLKEFIGEIKDGLKDVRSVQTCTDEEGKGGATFIGSSNVCCNMPSYV